MKDNLSLKANSRLSCQKIPRLLYHPKVHDCFHKTPPPKTLIQSTLSYSLSFKIYLHLGIPSVLFPSRFSIKMLYAFLISPKRVHLIMYIDQVIN
jgi:hypothetical protein